MTMSFPENTKDTIDSIRNAIGRTVTFKRITGQSGCSVSGCTLDPVTGASTNSFCPTCSGEYWIDQIERTPITAHVRWQKGQRAVAYPGGTVFEGDCRLQIEYSDTNATIVNESEKVIVDSKLMSIDETMMKGVPEVNRLVLIVNEEDSDG